MAAMERRAVSFQFLFIFVALPMIFGAGGFFMRDLYAEVKMVRDGKLDKVEFYQTVGHMDRKADLIIQLLRDHESNASKRSSGGR